MMTAADERVVLIGLEERPSSVGADRGYRIDALVIGDEEGIVKDEVLDRPRRVVAGKAQDKGRAV